MRHVPLPFARHRQLHEPIENTMNILRDSVRVVRCVGVGGEEIELIRSLIINQPTFGVCIFVLTDNRSSPCASTVRFSLYVTSRSTRTSSILPKTAV